MGKGKGGRGKQRYRWSSSRCEKQGARWRGKKLNEEEDMAYFCSSDPGARQELVRKAKS